LDPDPYPDPYWPPSGSSGSGSVKNEYGSETLVWGVTANEYNCAHGAQINFENLTPYLTYDARSMTQYLAIFCEVPKLGCNLSLNFTKNMVPNSKSCAVPV
jgi:hypothetical protein